jgi:enoyl-[acyl-carrier-protein] reductase (NADH)
MRESPLRLNDKTIILFGPGHSLTQALASYLNEQGADVAFVGPEAGGMRKFADNLMENRQISGSFGRAAAFESKLETEKDDLDVIAQVAQTLGGLEVVIDTHMNPFEGADAWRRRVAQSALKFLEGRRRGRLIFLAPLFKVPDPKTYELKAIGEGPLLEIFSDLKTPQSDKSITVNGLQIGVTEDFLLNQFKGVPLKESIENLKKKYPGFHLIESLEVATTAAFLASPLSSALSGQVIRLTKGLRF